MPIQGSQWKSESSKNWPWFTNSDGLALRAAALGSRVWLIVLIDDMLPCDWTALLSISNVLLVQKSSDLLSFLSVRPGFDDNLFGGSFTVTGFGFVWHARQPLLCYKTYLVLLCISHKNHHIISNKPLNIG